MKRPVLSRTRRRAFDAQWSGYTLVEILVATTLSLILLGAVVRMFGDVSQSITDSRAMLEASDRLRIAATRLQQDLAGVTVTMNPPRRPENNEGYFEYIEGPITQATASTYAMNTQVTPNVPDTTVGDFDDILMFTTRSTGRPFVGRVPTSVNASGTIQSDVAEVAWFVRGRTLYRRQLLVAPGLNPLTAGAATNFYANYDISASMQNSVLVANTLGDLTRRECRFAHPSATFPYAVSTWNWTTGSPSISIPTLPTMRECSLSTWAVGQGSATTPTITNLDFWSNDPSRRLSDTVFTSGTSGSRVADDVILTNVIGFDVKAWDPTAPVLFDSSANRAILPGDTGYTPTPSAPVSIVGHGAYVDLGYYPTYTSANFSTIGARVDRTATGGNGYLSRVYDTWSTHYETAGRYPADSLAGRSTNGFDDAGNDANGNPTPVDGIVDGPDEMLTSPPYPYPLRGIQVKIRVFEPDSRQILEWTVVQDFLPR